MGLRGFDFIHAEAGVYELFVEPNDLQAGVLVVCDAISPNDQGIPSQESQAAAALAETTIREMLGGRESVDEEAIQKAFEKANSRVSELYDEEHPVAVSGVALVLQPGPSQNAPHTLLIGGVGDTRVWRIDSKESALVFADPQVPEIHQTLSSEERSLALHNGMGNGEHLRVHIRRVVQNGFQRYLIASYGLHAQSTEEEIQKMGLHPHDPLTGVSAILRGKGQKGHQLRVFTATYETSAGGEEPEEVRAVPFESRSNTQQGNRKPLLALTGVTCALIAGAAVFGMGDSKAKEPALAQREAPASGELAVLRERVLLLSQERAELAELSDSLRAQLQTAKQSNTSPELREQWQRASDEQQAIIAKLQKELHQAQSSTSEPAKEAITELNQELAKAQGTVQALETEQEHAAEQLVALQDENRQLKEALEAVDGSTSSDDLLELTETLAHLQKQYVQEQVKALALQEELEEATSRKGVRKMRTEVKGLKKELTSLERENERLSHLVASTELAKEKAIEKVQHEAIERIEKAEQKLAKVLETQRDEGAEMLSEAQAQITQLQIALQTAQEEQQMLQQAVLTAEQSAQEGQLRTASLEQQLGEMQAIESASIRSQDELELALNREREQARRGSEELTASKTKLRELEMIHRTLTAKLDQLQRERSALLMDKASLMEKVTALAEFQEMYLEERALRTRQEQAMAQARPAPTPVSAAAGNIRYHLVESGDTLSALSLKYYGTSRRWQDILEANQLRDAKQVRVGSKLLIP